MDTSIKKYMNLCDLDFSEYERLNKEIIEKCQRIDELIKYIGMRYKEPISSEHPFTISFLGRFKTGKSSLLNALIGASLLPTKATTATSVITRVKYGIVPKCWLYDNLDKREISIEEGKDIILNYTVTDVDKAVEVLFELPISWMKNNIELRDTPGLDDSVQNGKLEKIALNTLKDTDLCICVYDASTMISEKERIRTQKINAMMCGNVVYAVNCINRLNTIEDVEQVEKFAKNFFTKFNYSISGMGKHYMICSAAKMIMLDGLDEWLQNFVNPANLSLLNQVRKNTGIGQVDVIKSDFSRGIQEYIPKIEQQIVTLNEQHEEIIKKKRKEMIHLTFEEVNDFDRLAANFIKEFTDYPLGLKDRIQKCKNNGSNYEENTKVETLSYYVKRYHVMRTRKHFSVYFSENDIQFIVDSFQSITFPGEHKKNIKATGKQKVGWTCAGAVIGGVLGGAIGAVIGTAISGKIGSVDSTIDDSVDNTMYFVTNTIIPLIQRAFENRISVIRKEIKNKGFQRCDSGLETILVQTVDVQRLLDNYIIYDA